MYIFKCIYKYVCIYEPADAATMKKKGFMLQPKKIRS